MKISMVNTADKVVSIYYNDYTISADIKVNTYDFLIALCNSINNPELIQSIMKQGQMVFADLRVEDWNAYVEHGTSAKELNNIVNFSRMNIGIRLINWEGNEKEHIDNLRYLLISKNGILKIKRNTGIKQYGSKYYRVEALYVMSDNTVQKLSMLGKTDLTNDDIYGLIKLKSTRQIKF
jgi:hypothetical protein